MSEGEIEDKSEPHMHSRGCPLQMIKLDDG